MTQREMDVVARLRMMASERDAYTKSGRPMHVNETMTSWLTEAAAEIERLRAALGNEQIAVPDEIRNDPAQCCRGLPQSECEKVPRGECERD